MYRGRQIPLLKVHFEMLDNNINLYTLYPSRRDNNDM